MLSYLNCFFCFLALTLAAEIGTNLKVRKYEDLNEKTNTAKVQVYYGSLNHDCIMWYRFDLNKTYTELGSYIELTLYPYGYARTSNVNGTTVVDCQYGPKECYGNKLHACAIDILKNISLSESYIHCMLMRQWGGQGSTDLDATKCGELMKIDSKPIIDCAKGQKGEELLEYYGKETEKIELTELPTVFVNGKLLKNRLEAMVCDSLAKPPPLCEF